MSGTSEAVAVLCSGGLDSVVLVAHEPEGAHAGRVDDAGTAGQQMQ